tara:strand:+ start:416 stop:673 length:258 start_codon:yes stop_codon:yes gene_type:complete
MTKNVPRHGIPARYSQEWVKRKVIKQDGTKGYCADHRQENDPSCWQKKSSLPMGGRQSLTPGRKFAGGAPRVGSMHKPHMRVAYR